MKASLNNYRQAPRKVRLVTNFIRGMEVGRATAELTHLPKRASGPILKLLKSSLANLSGDNLGALEAGNLYVKSISVDKGVIMKRSMPRAMGRAFPIHKHTSHIKLELAVRAQGAKRKTQSKRKYK